MLLLPQLEGWTDIPSHVYHFPGFNSLLKWQCLLALWAYFQLSMFLVGSIRFYYPLALL